MPSEIKKPKYVRKYDFQQSFYRPKDEWFLPIQYIIDLLKSKTKNYSHFVDDENEDEETTEFDVYEYTKQTSVNFDPADPKIYEGNKIDHDSKKFITDKYSFIKTIFDFDEKKWMSAEEAQNKTIELLQQNEDIILFQPTFIYKNKAIAKPDAFIKYKDEYILIETKGTTKTKAAHLVDIQYQATIVNETLSSLFNSKIKKFFLCLVEYKMDKKNNIGFVLVDCASTTKNGASVNETEKEKYEKFSQQYIELIALYKEGRKDNIKFSDLIYNSENIPESKYKKGGEVKTTYLKFLDNFNFINNRFSFDERIEEIFNQQINLSPSFVPTDEYKMCWFKQTDYWIELREYFMTQKKYLPFHYSGKLFRFEFAMDLYKNNFITEEQIYENIKKYTKAWCRYIELIKKNNFSLGGFDQNSVSLIESLKSKTKKVYFDFESINLATRVIDNTLPFMQTVNQVSVIFDHGDKVLSNSNNVLIDPQQIDLDSYKQIIDAILPSKDLSMCSQYIYIVYNKSFEVSRLNEMKALFKINQKTYANEYAQKVDVITKNIFDLADLFNLETPVSIAIKKNHGFYSIKKVLPIIDELYPDIFNEVKCLDYKKLHLIQNGSQAQKESTKRFFNLITNDEWKEIATNLKIYCENDVRAMIATEYMLYKIIQP